MGEAKRKAEEPTLIVCRIAYKADIPFHLKSLFDEKAVLRTEGGQLAEVLDPGLGAADGADPEDWLPMKVRVIVENGPIHGAVVEYESGTNKPLMDFPRMDLFWEIEILCDKVKNDPFGFDPDYVPGIDPAPVFVTDKGAYANYLGRSHNVNHSAYENNIPHMWEICEENYGALLTYTDNHHVVVDSRGHRMGQSYGLYRIRNADLAEAVFKSTTTSRAKLKAEKHKDETEAAVMALEEAVQKDLAKNENPGKGKDDPEV
jgi:hypothetical protein